jgi:NhaP-type Na+/H+ or K+/H+ antiporter
VWTTVVFLLNVLAFLLMGLQARRILGAMSAAEFDRAIWFAAAVVGGVIVTRLAAAFLYNSFARLRYRAGKGHAPVSLGETLLVGWTGMRGLVTLATAFALPANFPERDLVVLTAFAVVLATLVIQGATLAPMIRFLKLGRQAEACAERDAARVSLAEAALNELEDKEGDEAEALRQAYREYREGTLEQCQESPLNRRRTLSLAAILAQRRQLDELRNADKIGPDHYLELQEDLDWKQLAIVSDEERRISEN